MDVEKITGHTLYDAVFYRNATVEERLGVEINQILMASTASVSSEWNSTFRNAVLSKSDDFDAAAIYASTGSAMAVEGVYYNLLTLPHLELSQPWWNSSIVDELTLFNTLYFLGGDITVSEIANGLCVFYNKDLFSKLWGTDDINLYDVVEKGDWTIDYMTEFVMETWVDENNDGIVSDGDIVGFAAYPSTVEEGEMDAWIPAMGIKLTTMVDGYPELSFYNERTVTAFKKVQKLYNSEGTYRGGMRKTRFVNGNQLFVRGSLNSGESFRGMSARYGVLPLPKFDKAQSEYYTSFGNYSSLVVVPVTCRQTEAVGATLELMAAESYKQVTPAYFEICLQGKYSDSPEDSKMYDLIINSFEYSFGFCYSTHSLGGIGSLFRYVDGGDIAKTYRENETKYQTLLDSLIDKLDEISFNAE